MKRTREVNIRLPQDVYDKYCKWSARTGIDIQRLMFKTLSSNRCPGRPSQPPTVVVSLNIPKSLHRKYTWRTRRFKRPRQETIGTLLRRLLTNRAPDDW